MTDLNDKYTLAHGRGSVPDSGPTLILEAGRVERNYWTDIWAYRELFAILAWRDIAVQYKQTVIGAAWAVVRPLLTMLIFTVVFGRIAKFPSEGDAPYPVMVMAGMLPWFLFSTALSQAASSVVTNNSLISKVYFPRIIIPTASAVVALVDFAITLIILLLMMMFYGVWPTWRILFVPVFAVFAMLVALGPALLLASLNVRYRDFRFILPFVVQFGLYVSPVGFSSKVVPENWKILYSMNPVVGVIDGFRWSLLGGQSPIDWIALAPSVGVTAFFLWFGVRTFRETEKAFADLI